MKLRRGKGRGTRRHETDVRCGHKKLKSSSSLVFTLEAALKKTGKETYFASKFVARHTSVFTAIRPGHLPWKSQGAPTLVKGKRWQVHLMVRLVINPVDEFASTMENLSTLLWICRLPCRATRSTITRCYYHPGQFWLGVTNTLSSFLRMEPCTVYLAPDDGDGLVAKGVAHQGGVLLHDRRPIVRTHLPRVLSSCSGGLVN